MKLTLERAAEFMTASGSFSPGTCVAGYSIDSRTIQPSELFFAVKGERFDGHDFVTAALDKGAAGAVVSVQQLARFPDNHKVLAVADTLTALQTLGAAVRRVWNKPLIAITGSAGKTTTKEAIAHVLAARHHVFKSQGNLNNHFGLPLQLLKLEAQHEIAVVELGMSRAGEIATLAKLARPNCGVVTCVAPVHLEFFESISAIARAKYELIEAIPAHGIAVLNADDEYVSQFGRDFHGRVVTFGIDHPADVRAEKVAAAADGSATFDIAVDSVRASVRLPMIGRHNVRNALAAAAVGLQYGLSPTEIAQALTTMQPTDKRGERLSIAGATIINDSYNSNPVALRAMVDALATIDARRRIVVAGEMLELGPTAAELHFECGAYMAGKADLVIGVRGLAQNLVEGARSVAVKAEFLAGPEEAGDWLAQELESGDAVLLKASRGVRLERALERLNQRLAPTH